MPEHPYFSTPKLMNMGFHYTRQYSRRTRINVMGKVNHASPFWEEWYEAQHELSALLKMKQDGYDFIEIHFIYGFGFKGEAKEIELTRKMTGNAHKAELKVIGYYQFFSVQEEAFFIENPWAEKCLQLDENGQRRQYDYDRPALCFSHPEVKQYYLDGFRKGLIDCDLDGIRLDNDYFNGCYCPLCISRFREHLQEKYTRDRAEELFGLPDLSHVCAPPKRRKTNPMQLEWTLFNQQQRQKMMLMLREHADSIKPGAFLGGNPAVSRKADSDAHTSVYPADLGETHNLVCAENNNFPRVENYKLIYQAEIYKFGESAGFKCYPSHHLPGGNWPDTAGCALTFTEALAMGGHIPCTTWGLRYDAEYGTLYMHPEFMAAMRPFADFIHQHGHLWKNTRNIAKTAVYVNRESRIMFAEAAAESLKMVMQALLTDAIPFRLVPFDGEAHLDGVETLIVPDMRLISGAQLECFAKIPNVMFLGESGKYDEYALERETPPLCKPFVLPEPEIKIVGGRFVGANLCENSAGEKFLHLVNYDNRHPVKLNIEGAEILNAFTPDKTWQPLRNYCILQIK